MDGSKDDGKMANLIVAWLCSAFRGAFAGDGSRYMVFIMDLGGCSCGGCQPKRLRRCTLSGWQELCATLIGCGATERRLRASLLRREMPVARG